MIGCLGPMAGTVVVAVNPPGPSAQMAIAEAAGPCPEDTAFCRERNPPMLTRGDNGLTFKKKKLNPGGEFLMDFPVLAVTECRQRSVTHQIH